METNMTFPPSPSQSPFPPLIPHAQPSPPSNALVRAINVASKKLFGSPSPTQGSNPTKKDKFRERDWVGTPKEEELLNNLEDLAKKARVLMDWSDVKFKKVEAVPSSESSATIIS
jgi:serine/threonine-protein kinase ULK/ATG1